MNKRALHDETTHSPAKRLRVDTERELRQARYLLTRVFGKQDYRGKQEEVITAALQGHDCLLIAPTGMGKSLCFQVPAVAAPHGLTIVVSPLIALMDDQLQALDKLNIAAGSLSSKTDPDQARLILRDMHSGHPKTRLLYVTPERIALISFQRVLRVLYNHGELSRLVIDEAHCISQWGKDFRPDYAQLGLFRQLFPRVPIMALTASATPKVADDIITSLNLHENTLRRFEQSFNRAELYYEVAYVNAGPEQKRQQILEYIKKMTKARRDEPPPIISGIIYCRAKQTCDDLAAWLDAQGIAAKPYHRDVTEKELTTTQYQWLNNEQLASESKTRVDVVVATVKFGMGIDKASCRYVIHYDLPTSFEGYYQESGRAGRDGNIARCLIFYDRMDAARLQHLISASMKARNAHAAKVGVPSTQGLVTSSDSVINYCENVTTCRHEVIARYFGETIDEANVARLCHQMCDVCKFPERTRTRKKLLDASPSEDDGASSAALVPMIDPASDAFDAVCDDSSDIDDVYPVEPVDGENADPHESFLDSLDAETRLPSSPPIANVPVPVPVHEIAEDEELPEALPLKSRNNNLPRPNMVEPPAKEAPARRPTKSGTGFKVPFRSEAEGAMQAAKLAVTPDQPDDIWPSFKCKLVPSSGWAKDISKETRASSCKSIYLELIRAMLARGGLRKVEEEERMFDELDGGSIDTQRLTCLSTVSTEIESDCFWRSLGEAGYVEQVSRIKIGLRIMRTRNDWTEAVSASHQLEQVEAVLVSLRRGAQLYAAKRGKA
ncbi:uncharacterized protein L969DRAFT_14736 [Mixia osmundae IAM 14324]|uniref:ATP-dependent DNA helicase n=1 Tax=Mixia osmundae (strain CBS 9802 / IAM 14324 / JCM 22182 / KY 12970) TaxID=764103 RepID=G7E2Y8_MIXOS|nr:uncharacterized protein L969DRAFT_14736 [Mixia osmundae IAM 14324]KEI42543.1 hypothetical protein L969DRAFT_14736 [Mixia osmundae IAM 14324]GAA97169.1 hypothetical protein E5Q_03845 [Mixia osmundae IAM 14324]